MCMCVCVRVGGGSSVSFSLKITATEQIGSGCCVRRHRATVVLVYLGQMDRVLSQPSRRKKKRLKHLNSIRAFLRSGRSCSDRNICVCVCVCVIAYMHVCTGTCFINWCLELTHKKLMYCTFQLYVKDIKCAVVSVWSPPLNLLQKMCLKQITKRFFLSRKSRRKKGNVILTFSSQQY